MTVEESELDDYQPILQMGVKLVPHPPTSGLGELRQWILDHFDDRCIVQCNDNVRSVLCLVGKAPRRITDPNAIFRIFHNSAEIVEGIGISVFCYNPVGSDVRKFWPNEPIRFNRIEGCLFGMVGRRVRFDPRVKQHDDVDLTLECLRVDRIVWQDSRFAAEHNFMTGSGGNSEVRGRDSMLAELRYMKEKWGKYFVVTDRKTMLSTMISCPRKQEIK